MLYYLTQEQLNELQVLVWGARFTKPDEPDKFSHLIAEIKNQTLPVEPVQSR
jgi:hypothetical protein